jgi:hypothetical protein
MFGGGGHYTTGGAGVQQIPIKGNNFPSGFIAGYSSCVPPSHFIGYTHPV